MTAQLQMDESGRVLIPEDLRTALGLHPGAPLDAEIRDGKLVLQTAAPAARLVEYEGRLVIETTMPIVGDPVEETRQQRMKDILESC